MTAARGNGNRTEAPTSFSTSTNDSRIPGSAGLELHREGEREAGLVAAHVDAELEHPALARVVRPADAEAERADDERAGLRVDVQPLEADGRQIVLVAPGGVEESHAR